MKRHHILPRQNWKNEVEKLGFSFHSLGNNYWNESACYSFSVAEIDELEKASNQLWNMCLQAVQYIIDNKAYSHFHLPEWFWQWVEASWEYDAPSIYARFDLAYHNGRIKLLECNGDTPTSLFEAATVQWFWLNDYNPKYDQFNSIHERLVAYWRVLKPYLHQRSALHFSSQRAHEEDFVNTEYMRDCAIQVGLDTKFIDVNDIGWDFGNNVFVDKEDIIIQNIFKLYPYEWLVFEEFAQYIPQSKAPMHWIEPPWKILLSNKALLVYLWQLFPNHPLLLPAYFEPSKLSSYAKKPIFGREGANIELVKNGKTLVASAGDYGVEGFVFQELFELPNFENHHPVIGSWIIGQESAGIGIRESSGLITDNQSTFVPHYIA